MARPVFSVLIASLTAATGATVVPLDPAYVWIIRDIDVYVDPTTGGATGTIADAYTGIIFMAWSYALGDGGVSSWRGRQVISGSTPGLGIVRLGDASVRISGYRLTPT
jgi:hypothetical protein